jgi:carbonic anhydrase/acetyltransferase-like protein (isoleucine patch superfamily)
MTNKKYEFTGETLIEDGIVLRQIRALRSIGGEAKGNVGGWIESERNLSHEGECWVEEGSVVYGDVCVLGDARVMGSSVIRGESIIIRDEACVRDSTVEGLNVGIFGNAFVDDNSHIQGNNCQIGNSAVITGSVSVYGEATIRDYARVENGAIINALNFEAMIEDVVKITDGASVLCDSEPVRVCGYARIGHGATLRSTRDYMCFRDCFIDNEDLTWTRRDDRWTVGTFNGTAAELLEYGRTEGVEYEGYYAAFIELVEKIKNLPITN